MGSREEDRQRVGHCVEEIETATRTAQDLRPDLVVRLRPLRTVHPDAPVGHPSSRRLASLLAWPSRVLPAQHAVSDLRSRGRARTAGARRRRPPGATRRRADRPFRPTVGHECRHGEDGTEAFARRTTSSNIALRYLRRCRTTIAIPTVRSKALARRGETHLHGEREAHEHLSATKIDDVTVRFASDLQCLEGLPPTS